MISTLFLVGVAARWNRTRHPADETTAGIKVFSGPK